MTTNRRPLTRSPLSTHAPAALGLLLAALAVAAPAPALAAPRPGRGAAPPGLRVAAVERSADAHGGTGAVEGARCENRGASWACVRYRAGSAVLPGSPVVPPRAWAPLSQRDAAALQAAMEAEQVLRLPDAVATGPSAINTKVFVQVGPTHRQFRVAVAAGSAPAERPQDRVVAAIWQAATAARARPVHLQR